MIIKNFTYKTYVEKNKKFTHEKILWVKNQEIYSWEIFMGKKIRNLQIIKNYDIW